MFWILLFSFSGSGVSACGFTCYSHFCELEWFWFPTNLVIFKGLKTLLHVRPTSKGDPNTNICVSVVTRCQSRATFSTCSESFENPLEFTSLPKLLFPRHHMILVEENKNSTSAGAVTPPKRQRRVDRFFCLLSVLPVLFFIWQPLFSDRNVPQMGSNLVFDWMLFIIVPNKETFDQL